MSAIRTTAETAGQKTVEFITWLVIGILAILLLLSMAGHIVGDALR